MLEQSTLHGFIYRSMISDKVISSRKVAPSDIVFGPMRQIQIHAVADDDVWVKDMGHGTWYHYVGGNVMRLVETKEEREPVESGATYYYGKAVYDGKSHLYFIQNIPNVTSTEIPSVETFELPLTMRKLCYDITFSYTEKVKRLLRGVPAAYVDKYKRPIQISRGRVYPVDMEKVKTTWDDLPDAKYPVVLAFQKTAFAVLDLEPEHTEEDERQFDKVPGFYEEDTPRGGRHKIVRCISGEFKFRFSKGLELINQSQVTLYGINGNWLSDDPEPINVSDYRVVGHVRREAVQGAPISAPDVEADVKWLREAAKRTGSMGVISAMSAYRSDPDVSHGEFVALRILYKQDVERYKENYPPGRLPWILASYATTVIEHRDKHETSRSGLPYLVYLSAIILTRREVRGGQTPYQEQK